MADERTKYTRTRLRGWILVPVTVGLSFWLMTAANFGLGRPPDASRYKYMGAVFVLMIAAELPPAGGLDGRRSWGSSRSGW